MAVQRLNDRTAEIRSRTEYVERLYTHDAPAEVHVQVEARLRQATESAYQLDQPLMMPALLD